MAGKEELKLSGKYLNHLMIKIDHAYLKEALVKDVRSDNDKQLKELMESDYI